jgi:5'-3' exonuclease
MKLLIDADFIVYKNCASCEDEIDFGNDVILVTSKFSEAYKAVKRDIEKISDQYMDPDVYLFFSDSDNFRKQILPEYKGHRNRKKPCGYRRVINQLKNEFNVITLPTLEADDAMGIFATMWEDTTICSPDKDMRQIPGHLYDMKENTFITKSEGLRWHLIQSMAGDQTDGYGGCPGIGIKRAVAIFEKDGYTWEAVVKTFAEKDLSEDIALQNARLAKILTIDEYDFETKTIRHWTPDADYRVNT